MSVWNLKKPEKGHFKRQNNTINQNIEYPKCWNVFRRYSLCKSYKVLGSFFIYYPFLPIFECLSMYDHASFPRQFMDSNVRLRQWNAVETMHNTGPTNIWKVYEKGVINNKTYQNFLEFIQWILTKHIPKFIIVRILIFFIVFWPWK